MTAAAPPLLLLVGAVLLVAGRRLFWFTVGAAGFLVAFGLAGRLLDTGHPGLRLGLGIAAGVAGALLAVLLQRAAVAFAGFLLGGYAALLLVGGGGPEVGWQGCALFLLGGVVAAVVAGAVFEIALVALSSLLGSALILDALGTAGAAALLFGVALAVAGAVVQLGSLRRERRVERRSAA